MKFDKLKITPKENIIHLVSIAEKDCVAQLYATRDPLLGRMIFNLITLEEVQDLDPQKAKMLGKVIDEVPVISGEMMCIKKKMNENTLPTILNLNEDDLNDLFSANRKVGEISFDNFKKAEILHELGEPVDFEMKDENVYILSLDVQVDIHSFQDNYAFCNINKEEVVFPQNMLSKVANTFLEDTREIQQEGFEFLKFMRDIIKKNVIFDPAVQMELTLLESAINKYESNSIENDEKIESYISVDDDLWNEVISSTSGIISLPKGLTYSDLPNLGSMKSMLESTVGSHVWNMSKDIFKNITRTQMEDIKVLNAPNAYDSPLSTYLDELKTIGIKKEISEKAKYAINQIYHPDEVSLYAIGDMEVLYVQDPYHESFYFFPTSEALENNRNFNNSYKL
jgi:hypothetical protein